MKMYIVLSVAVTLVICSTMSANAATIGTNAVYSRDGSVLTEDPRTSPTPDSLTSVVQSNSSDYLLGGRTPHAKAVNVNGFTSVNAEAIFASGNNAKIDQLSAEATFSEVITNTNTITTEYWYYFDVVGPNLKVFDFAGLAGVGVLGSPKASYQIEIKVDGVVLFGSYGSLTGGTMGGGLSGSGTAFTHAGMSSLGGSGWEVQFSNYQGLIHLGDLAVGQEFLFETLVKVSVSAYPYELGGAAFIGDPGDITSPGFTGVMKQTQIGAAVPEPTTFLLLGIGIAGLAGADVRRRRKKKAMPNS